MKYPRTCITLGFSLLVFATACLSPRAKEIVKAAAPLVVNLSELGELSGKLPPGSTVAIRDGTAIITSDGSTTEKIMQLKTLGLEQAVKEGALKEGDALIVDKAGTSLVQIVEAIRQPPATADPAAGPSSPLLPAPPN